MHWSPLAGIAVVVGLFFVTGEQIDSNEAQRRINPRDHLVYLKVPAGDFAFGCSAGDRECFSWELPCRKVHVRDFWIGETEVTQTAYRTVMGSNPSLYLGPNRPVDRVGWSEAADYCRAIGLRLPSEIEWEYAARAGDSRPRYGTLDNIAWYDGNSHDQTHEVARKQPNRFGLYDTLGNVWEWVDATWEHDGRKRMLRGDSFYNPAYQVRVSDRLWALPDTAHRDMGFRCAGD